MLENLQTFTSEISLMDLAIFVPSLMAISYLSVPIIALLTLEFRTSPHYDVFDPEQSRPPEYVDDCDDFFDSASRDLEKAGFSFVHHISTTDLVVVPKLIDFIMLFENRAQGDLAMATITWVKTEYSRGFSLQSKSVEFRAEFEDGSSITTHDGTFETPFAPVARRTVLHFSDVRVRLQLYRIHQHAIQEFADGKTKRSLPPTEELVATLERDVAEEVQEQIATGYLYLGPSQECYRPTWKGAYLMVWKQVWPMSALRRASRRRRAAKLLADWNIDA